MVTAVGTNGKVAIKKAATWGTAVTLGAGDRTPFVSSGVTAQSDYILDDDINDSGGRGISNPGNVFVEGPLVLNGDYRQPEGMTLAALLSGSAGVPVESPTGVYTHVMKMQPDNNGLFCTYGVDWGGIAGATWGFSTVKPSRRLISVPSSDKMQETFDFIGAGVTKGLDSSAWDYAVDPTDGETIRVLHRQHVVRVNAQSGGALGASDEQAATSIEIEINRALGRDFTSGGDIDEPVPSDFWEITFRLSFFGASAERMDLFRAAYDDGSSLKADLVFDSGRLIDGTAENFKRSYYFPKLRVTECPVVIDGPGPLPFAVTMTAHQAASDPTGFPAGYVEALIEEWQNDQAADPLA